MNSEKKIASPGTDLLKCRGRFRIPASWLYGRAEAVHRDAFDLSLKIFKDMIITKCEYGFAREGFMYEAYGPMFSEVADDCYEPPEYAVVVQKDGSVIFDFIGQTEDSKIEALKEAKKFILDVSPAEIHRPLRAKVMELIRKALGER